MSISFCDIVVGQWISVTISPYSQKHIGDRWLDTKYSGLVIKKGETPLDSFLRLADGSISPFLSNYVDGVAMCMYNIETPPADLLINDIKLKYIYLAFCDSDPEKGEFPIMISPIFNINENIEPPTINLHELTNGLVPYYNERFGTTVLGKKQYRSSDSKAEGWGYYQNLETITTLLKNCNHDVISRLAYYHIKNVIHLFFYYFH